MFENLTGKQRLLLGLLVLFVVDLIWVGSSELTEYIFQNIAYKKPFFTTYMKTAMFIVYLAGFLFRKTWRQRCRWPKVMRAVADSPSNLSEPVYVPINDDDGYSSIDSSDTEASPSLVTHSINVVAARKAVRFSEHTEVRVMTSDDADEANLARLSYNEFMRAQEERARLNKKFPVPTVCKLALVFCLLWFSANFCYQEALLNTEAGVVNVLSSLSGLFTLVMAAIWSSGPVDKFTLSKLLAVLLSLGGTAMICLSNAKSGSKVPIGAVWAIVSALAYALYLVSLKRKVNDDEQLDIPMFFGFVGLFNIIILWPGLLILHYTHWETFQLPDREQLLLMVLNGVVGTVLSELLWLWGCFLTSSLIGTLALSLTAPLTMLFDILIRKVSYSWMFYAGVGPILLSFVAVTAFSHYDNYDPALIAIRKLTKCMTRSMQLARLREMDTDVRQQLIPGSRGSID